MSQREKYNKAVQLTNKLAVVMSESGQYEFDIKFSFLSSILVCDNARATCSHV